MKKTKLFLCLIAAAMMCVFFGISASAATVDEGICGENLVWVLDDNGTLDISGEGEMADFSSGSSPWHQYRYQIENINVGYGITTIGQYSFAFLQNVETVSLPDTLEKIKKDAFFSSAFAEIQLPDSLKIIEAYAFHYCSFLKSITIPPLVQSIDATVFLENDSLSSIDVHPDSEFFSSENGVLYSKDKSTLLIYPNGKNDTSFNVPEYVEIIGKESFAFNQYLQSVKISDSVTLIEEFAFWSISSLQKVEFGKNVTEIGKHAFNGCSELSEIKLSENLISIGDGAFQSCESISQIEFPDTLQYIGSGAFLYCSGISSITIPASVRKIETMVFGGSEALTEIIVDEQNENYCSEDGVLYNKSMSILECYPTGKSDVEFLVPDKVVAINVFAFEFNSHIEEINFSRNSAIREIGQVAFRYCTSLKRVTIPKNCEYVYGNTFEGCSALEGIYVDYENQYFSSFGGVLFDKAEETLIVYPGAMETETYIVPASVKVIEESSFNNCANLKNVLFENGSELIEIKEYAFEGCTALEYIALPDSLERIESFAFGQCEAMPFICIPENVTSIDRFAFSNCYALEKILFLPRECETSGFMDDTISHSSAPKMSAVFYVYKDSTVESALSAQGECRYLFEEYDDAYSYSDGVLIMNNIETLPDTNDSFRYPWARYSRDTAGIVLNNVGDIGANVFGDFSECTAVIVKTDAENAPVVTAFAENSFAGCNSMKTIVCVSDIFVAENAFVGNEQPVTVFASDTVNCETYTDSVTFTFNDGVVSLSQAQLSLTEYDFFDIVTAVCYALSDMTVNMFEFAEVETVGFAFNSYFENEEDNPVRVSYENIKVVPLRTYDGESFEQISFNEFCESAASDDEAFLMLKLYEETQEEPVPDDEDSVFVSFSEIGEYILRAIITFFNKLLNLFKRK